MTDMASSAQQDDLVARIASGDRDAFARLYREYRPDVFRFAAHMCGAPALAEDVVQDVFLAVIHSAARYQPGRSGVKAWLLGIAANHVRRWRHRRIFLPLPDETSRDHRSMSIDADPAAELTRQQHEAAVSRAILALPMRYRAVVVMCDIEELSYEDAASAAGCAIGTVRSRLHRGRALLRRALGESPLDGVCAAPATKQGLTR